MKRMIMFACVALSTLASASAAAATRKVIGYLQYEDYDFQNNQYVYKGLKPIRNVAVTVKVNGASVGATQTLSTGYFSKDIDSTLGGTVTAEIQSKDAYSNVYLDLDWQNHRLTWATPGKAFSPGTTVVDMGPYAVTKDNMSAHFNILDAIHYGWSYANGRRSGSDSPGCVDVQYPDAGDTEYVDGWGEITLQGPPSPWGYGLAGLAPDGYIDNTILHEYGHRLEYTISDADGGHPDHTGCDDIDTAVRWKEGFAYYFAGAVRSTYSQITDASNYEPMSQCQYPGSEDAVVATLWDLYDGVGPSEPFDRIDGARSTPSGSVRDVVFKIFDKELDDVTIDAAGILHDPKTDITEFHDAFVARNLYEGAHEDLDRLYAGNGVPTHSLCDYTVPNVTLGWQAMWAGNPLDVNVTLQNSSSFHYTDAGVTLETYLLAPQKVVLDSVKIPQFSGTKQVTRTVTMPAWLPAGYYQIRVDIDPKAEDLILEGPGKEDNLSPSVPGVYVNKCGDGACTPGETCSTCATDCGACCGNGACDWFENCETCQADCGTCGPGYCGDGICSGETAQSCPGDCGVGDGSCFVAGTPITMADGSTKPIESIAAGDIVLSFDTSSGQLVPGTVERSIVHADSDQLILVGGTLTTTAMHRFYSEGEWVRADALSPGASLLRVQNVDPTAGASVSVSTATVESLTALPGRATTYNFEVAKHHDYFAGGVLVHNIKP